MTRTANVFGFVGAILLAVPASAAPYILVSNYGNGSVSKYDAASGNYLGALVSSGSGGLSSPEGLAVGPDGNLYVASAATHSVKKYNMSTGAYIGTFASGSGLRYPRGLNFGPDGNLYVVSWNTGGSTVMRFNGQTGTFMDYFVPAGTQYYGGNPNDVNFRGDYMYVSTYEPVDHGIVRHDASTGALEGMFATSPETFELQGFTFGSDGNIYAGDSPRNVVRRYDGQTGEYIGVFATTGGTGGSGAEDVLFNVDGNLLVTSYDASRILRFDGTTGAALGTFAATGLNHPTYMVVVPEPSSLVAICLAGTLMARRR